MEDKTDQVKVIDLSNSPKDLFLSIANRFQWFVDLSFASKDTFLEYATRF